jgi:hypothetical protein
MMFDARQDHIPQLRRTTFHDSRDSVRKLLFGMASGWKEIKKRKR